MVQNRIYCINTEAANKIKEDAERSTSLHLVEIQGKDIQSWKEYCIQYFLF